jgi:hypothetical protein
VEIDMFSAIDGRIDRVWSVTGERAFPDFEERT